MRRAARLLLSRARVEVSPGPIEVLLDVPGWLGARGLLGGVVTVRVRADPSRLPPYGDEEPQLVATVTHPRVRAGAELAVAPAGPGRWLVTTRVSCEYLAELRAFDEVAVRMRLGGTAQNRVTMRFEYWRRADGREELVARGEQEVACMRRQDGRVVPAPVPPELREALLPFGAPGP